MNRKDLFKNGFKSVFNFAAETTEELGKTIQEVWTEEKKLPSEKNLTPVKKISEHKNKTTVKSKLFRTLALPPGANKNFFSLCTGCNECIFSCPYTVLFPVISQKDERSFPFFDPNAKGCHLCYDWPCINACPEDALTMYDVSKTTPKFGKAKCIGKHCINDQTKEKTCDACQLACPIEKTVNFRANLPIFSDSTCTGCGLCVEACPTFPKAIQIKTLNNISIS